MLAMEQKVSDLFVAVYMPVKITTQSLSDLCVLTAGSLRIRIIFGEFPLRLGVIGCVHKVASRTHTPVSKKNQTFQAFTTGLHN